MTPPASAPTVTLFTAEPVWFFFVVTDPDERQPDQWVLSTHVSKTSGRGHRIARRAVTLEEAGEITTLSRASRPLMYIAWEEEPGIQAALYALDVDPAEAWKPEEERQLQGVYLGTVVRARECRVAPNDLEREAADHFAAIMDGKTVEPIEQLMKRLG